LPANNRYLGADLPGNRDASIVIQPDGRLALPADSADVELSTQVLEHVDDPAVYLAECFRILRPGGRLLLSTHGHMVYHPDPVDYWRWTGAGLRRIVTLAGFEVQKLTGMVGLTAVGIQFFQDGLWGRMPGRIRPWFTRLTQWLIAVVDKRETARMLENNALVYVITAVKPNRP
jgi:SAM-dependent methyltransferase